MSPEDRDQYDTLLGGPTELPKRLVEMHEKVSKLYGRIGGSTLHPMLALMVVHLSCKNIETPQEKEAREAEAARALKEEERRQERQKELRAAKKAAKEAEKVGA